MFGEKLAAGFSVMKLYQAMAASLFFWACMFFKDMLVVFQVSLGVVLILGTISCILLECLFVRFDEKKNEEEETPRSGRKKSLEPKGFMGKIMSLLPFPRLPDLSDLKSKLPFGKK